MMYKTLALVALLAKNASAGGYANGVDPRTLWFRWAIPYGSGYEDKDSPKYNEYGQSVRQCGSKIKPNSIRQCYYTDCFKRLHGGANLNAQTRRRMAGSEVHVKVAKGSFTDADGKYGNKNAGEVYEDCGYQTKQGRRRMAGGPEMAIQCKSSYCQAPLDTKQFRYWRSGAAAYSGLENGTLYGACPGGTQAENEGTATKGSTDVKGEMSFQWYGTLQKAGGNCIYKNAPRGCQCKTLVCRVSADNEYEEKLETGTDTSKWGNPGGSGNNDGAVPAGDQVYDECNFIVRIEDAWSSPLVPKMWMWNIFSVSGAIALTLTAYYYVTYGDKLVVEEEGGSEGSGN